MTDDEPVHSVIARLKSVTARVQNLNVLLSNDNDTLERSDREVLRSLLSRSLHEQAALEAKLMILGGGK